MDLHIAIAKFKEFIKPENLYNLAIDFDDLANRIDSYYPGEVYSCKSLSERHGYQIDFVNKNGSELITVFIDYNTFLKDSLLPLIQTFKNQITKQVLTTHHDKVNLLITNINKELNGILISCKKSDDSKMLIPFFEELQQYLTQTYNLEASYLEASEDTKVMVKEEPQIRWLGNLNILTTFLLDLRSGENTSGKPLIECETKALINLVLENFVDAKGNKLSSQTINTYFDSNKQAEKRNKKNPLLFNKDSFETKPQATPPQFQKSAHYVEKTSIPKVNEDDKMVS